jgi:hypothetical protein
MAGITLEQAQAKLTTWLEAEEAVACGQSYQIGGLTLTRANLREIAERIEYWDGKVKMLSGKAGPAFNVGIPRRR